MGELMDVLAPALSSTTRPKSAYRGDEPKRRYPAGDPFAINEVRLLLNCLAYNTAHVARSIVEDQTGDGWSLRRITERVLRVAARVIVHGGYATVIMSVVALFDGARINLCDGVLPLVESGASYDVRTLFWDSVPDPGI